jgi:G3E family GTPase
MNGYDNQFVVQGVHMILDGHIGPQWTENSVVNRKSKLVFIGQNLSKDVLTEAFLSCCVAEPS